MGKKKKGFNWRAREQPDGQLETSQLASMQTILQIPGMRNDLSQGTNILALPSKRSKQKTEKTVQPVGKILSKKQRKRLEKIVDIKKKKENRAQLLKDLASVQADPSTLIGLESLASAQTKGVKRQLQEETEIIRVMQTEGMSLLEVQQVHRRKAKKRKVEIEKVQGPQIHHREDVLGFDVTSSSDSESECEDGAPEGGSLKGNEPLPVKEHAEKEEKQKIDEICTSDAALNSQTQNASAMAGPDHGFSKIKERSSQLARSDEDQSTDIERITANSRKPVATTYVAVERSKEIEEARSQLPITGEEQLIMETINSHQVVILSGETGSGKTTQVPQFLYEAGYATEGKMIGITEPRRVAATAMAARVAVELGLSSDEVSYQIRFQGNTTEKTKIKFMTDGVLLREVEKDFMLSKYSVIILDEAHERSVFTDILIGLLSRIVPLRHKRGNPLKLIIMSATLRVSDFTENSRLFRSGPPPVINVESRQFPVTIHFNKVTAEDYLGEAYRKVCRIHRQLPDGGILVFLTGQAEVNSLVRKLRSTFPAPDEQTCQGDRQDNRHIRPRLNRKKEKPAERKVGDLPKIDLSGYSAEPTSYLRTEDEGDNEEEAEDEDLDEEAIALMGQEVGLQPLFVLPLYSLLSQERQNRIFLGAPEGSRLCVVSTNIAETSLTIPGIKYVVDCGRVKTKFYDKVTGVTSFVVTWASQAAANQRAGRAGRQGPGHTYRLYSSAVFNNDMKPFAEPEIQQKPADGLLLQMKAMKIDKVVNFPFPSPPDMIQLRTGEERLQVLGILESPAPGLPLKEAEKVRYTSALTPLGRVVASFPLAPRFGKMLALSQQHGLLPLCLALVSALSVPEVLIERGFAGDGQEDTRTPKHILALRRQWAGQGSTLGLGDPMVLLTAVIRAEKSPDLVEFCSSVGLRPKGLEEIRRLRRQLSSEVEMVLGGGQLLQPGLQPPSQQEARQLQQLILAGCGDQVGRRIPEGEEGYAKGAYRVGALAQPAFIHSSSVLKKVNPEWIVFQEVFETDRLLLRGVTMILPEWLPKYVPRLCNLGKPIEEPPPRYCPLTGKVLATLQGTFGPCGWALPAVEMEHPAGPDRVRLFAKFLLEGRVAPQLEKFTSSLLSSPVIMIKSWSSLQPRTELLYRALAGAGVDSAASLAELWRTQPRFLLPAYQSWLPEARHQEAADIWPPAVQPEQPT